MRYMVQMEESFKTSLLDCEGKSECPVRNRLTEWI